MLLPPPGQLAFREAYQTKGWQAWVLCEAGATRRRLEDAWAVVPSANMAGTVWDAFAVFDGLGGRANGQEAAWAAASGLPAAMARSHGPEHLLRLLDPAVRAAAGAATAAVFLADRLSPEAWLLGVGDCSAYRLGGHGEVLSLLPHDRNGRHLVTDCLGVGFRGGRAVRVLEVARGESLLLCSDGVEEAGPRSLARCLAAGPDDAYEALALLLEDARHRGSTDDATALLVRRT